MGENSSSYFFSSDSKFILLGEAEEDSTRYCFNSNSKLENGNLGWEFLGGEETVAQSFEHSPQC